MGYHPRIESKEHSNFLTSRTRHSQLWFVGNQVLEDAILGYLAKATDSRNVDLYAFALTGNHIHATALFTHHNRSDFMRDFKANVARAVDRHCPSFPGGILWGGRYSNEFLPAPDDVEEWFFYTVLQPVQDGLVEKLSEFPGYNCFHDAIWGVERKVYVVNWTAYNEARRWRKYVPIKDYREEYLLSYKRLPGYEDLSQRAYAKIMLEKLEARRLQIVAARREAGKGFAGRAALQRIKPGARPRKTKTSTRYSFRPRILCVCPTRRKETLEWYFTLQTDYRNASDSYRAGNYAAHFPHGTYKPVCTTWITAEHPT